MRRDKTLPQRHRGHRGKNLFYSLCPLCLCGNLLWLRLALRASDADSRFRGLAAHPPQVFLDLGVVAQPLDGGQVEQLGIGKENVDLAVAGRAEQRQRPALPALAQWHKVVARDPNRGPAAQLANTQFRR